MITIIPDYITNDDIDQFLQIVDWSKEVDHPSPTGIKSINGLLVRPKIIYDKVNELGKTGNTELLIYNEKTRSYPHIDDESYGNNYNWTSTGILFLSDPKDYEGGEFCLDHLNLKMKPTRGTYIKFKAGPNTHQYMHSVKQVIRGRRLVLVFRYTCG